MSRSSSLKSHKRTQILTGCRQLQAKAHGRRAAAAAAASERPARLILEVGTGPASDEGLLEGLGRRADDAVGEGELNIAQVVLVGALAKHVIADRRGAHNLHVAEAGAMARGNILKHLGDSTVHAHVAVLAVHVVVTRPRIVAHPDAVVGHSVRPLLDNLQEAAKKANMFKCCITQRSNNSNLTQYKTN